MPAAIRHVAAATITTTRLRRRRQRVEAVQPRDHVDAGRDHRRGVDEGRDRRRAGHRVGQPDVQRDLGRLARRSEEEQQADRSVAADAPNQPIGAVSVAANARSWTFSWMRGEVERARHLPEQEHAEQEAGVADPVDDERLEARLGLLGVRPPEPDQEVAAEPDALPARRTARRGRRRGRGAS